MHITNEARYRIQLAQGFLTEAKQDKGLQRWRSCVANSQLAAENGAKAALALAGPVGRTHEPAVILKRMVKQGRYPLDICKQVERIAECAEELGSDVHIESDYGDEKNWRTPWELFDETAALRALGLAEEAVGLSRKLIQGD